MVKTTCQYYVYINILVIILTLWIEEFKILIEQNDTNYENTFKILWEIRITGNISIKRTNKRIISNHRGELSHPMLENNCFHDTGKIIRKKNLSCRVAKIENVDVNIVACTVGRLRAGEKRRPSTHVSYSGTGECND